MAQGVEHKAHNNRIQAPAFVAEVPDIPRQHRSFAETGGRIPVAVKSLYPSYLPNEASDKDNHYYGEYNLTHLA